MADKPIDLNVCPDCGLPEAVRANIDRMCEDPEHMMGKRTVRYVSVDALHDRINERVAEIDGPLDCVTDEQLAEMATYAQVRSWLDNDALSEDRDD